MILTGTSAIVTGGAVRIGRSICRRLAQAGANVCVHYGSSSQEAEETVQECLSLGVRACPVQADLAEASAARRIVEEATAALGPISILVNSASIFESAGTLETNEDQWDRHFRINVKAPFFLTQEFFRHLPDDLEGGIVNILDWRALRPVPGHASYTLAKAGLAAMTRMHALELGPRVRVNAVAPGAILPAPGDSQEAFDARARLNPLKRTGTPEAVADAVALLLQASFVTGEVLHVTGGEQL